MGTLELKGKYCKDIKIFTTNVEETALAQLYKLIEHPAYTDKKVRIMPDVHAGKGISVIGFSMPVDIEHDNISPESIGCDIGCSISMTLFDKPIEEDKMAEFEHKIRKEIPFGFEINKNAKVDVKYLIRCFNNVLNKLYSAYPIFAQYGVEFKKEKDLEDWCDKLNMDYGTFLKSIGSVGGGESVDCHRVS